MWKTKVPKIINYTFFEKPLTMLFHKYFSWNRCRGRGSCLKYPFVKPIMNLIWILTNIYIKIFSMNNFENLAVHYSVEDEGIIEFDLFLTVLSVLSISLLAFIKLFMNWFFLIEREFGVNTRECRRCFTKVLSIWDFKRLYVRSSVFRSHQVIRQGKFIAVAYSLRTYWNQFSLGSVCKQE